MASKSREERISRRVLGVLLGFDPGAISCDVGHRGALDGDDAIGDERDHTPARYVVPNVRAEKPLAEVARLEAKHGVTGEVRDGHGRDNERGRCARLELAR